VLWAFLAPNLKLPTMSYEENQLNKFGTSPSENRQQHKKNVLARALWQKIVLLWIPSEKSPKKFRGGTWS